MQVVVTQHLTKKFENCLAVDQVNVTISEGEIFGLVGPDGAGKTTLLRMLTTIVEPCSGELSVLGLSALKQAEAIKAKIGYLSQKCGLYPDLTVLENIEFFADIYCIPKKNRKNKIHELLQMSNLEAFQKRLAGNLSGGMKQKLGLACALIHQPQVLFLDEPTYGVDPVSRRELWRILYQLVGQKMTIVLATSDMNEAERCSQLGFMYKGRMIAQGAPEDLRHSNSNCFLEIKSDKAPILYPLLQAEFGHLHVRQCGNRIHLCVTNPVKASEVISRMVYEHRLGHYVTASIEPSLEDVFMALAQHFEGIN